LFSKFVDVVDLDVRQPERARHAAFDDAAADDAAEIEGEIRAGSGDDSLRAPAQKLRVEGTRSRFVSGVKLEVRETTWMRSIDVHVS
jgi:hypothetical protein